MIRSEYLDCEICSIYTPIPERQDGESSLFPSNGVTSLTQSSARSPHMGKLCTHKDVDCVGERTLWRLSRDVCWGFHDVRTEFNII